MVLSHKRLKQKLRSLLAESLAAEQSGKSPQDAGISEYITLQLQSLKELLGTQNQKPRSSTRRKKQSPSEDSKPVEISEEAQKENGGSVGLNKKRKREGDAVAEDAVAELAGDGSAESLKNQKKKKQKKQKKKRDKKKKKKDKEKENPEKGNEDVNSEINEERVVEPTKIGVSQENDDGAKKVYVGGIPYYSTEDDIRSFFHDCGTVTEVDCMRFPETGKFRGIAILTFKTEAAARRALALDGADMGGLYLKMQPYKSTRPQKSDFNPQVVDGYNRIYAGNLSWDITEDDLRKFFSDCNVSSIRFGEDKATGEFKGYAHVDFGDSLSLTIALKLDQKVVCGRPVRIRCAVPKKETGKEESSRKPPSKITESSSTEKEMGKETSSKPIMSKIVESSSTEKELGKETSSKKIVGNVPNNSVSGNSKKKKRRTCYVCGIPGHLSSSCPKKNAAENSSART